MTTTKKTHARSRMVCYSVCVDIILFSYIFYSGKFRRIGKTVFLTTKKSGDTHNCVYVSVTQCYADNYFIL